ncbi:MAG TPA: diacylglycerol kinase family protein [Candidatus Dormibacteraeota bacterium]|nr:diacylglycerol kinase family protein [Candidatus Dormibacteraeota bacterium]
MSGLQDGRAVAIVNPAADGGTAERHIKELARVFRGTGARVDMLRTPASGEAVRLARDAVAEGYTRVIAAGGDGTVNEVVNGIFGSDAELAIVPLGSANDFAHSLGLRDWRAAARLAVSGEARPVDLATANGRAFANCVGVGADAAGARVLERHKRVVGSLAYLTAAIRTIAVYRPRNLRVQIDGETIIGPHFLVVVANGERFAKGMRIAPGARVDDGLLDVCVIGNTTVAEAVVLLARVYAGTHVSRPKVRMAKVRELLIEQEGPQPVQFDGEPSQADRLEVRCLPGALPVVTPAAP